MNANLDAIIAGSMRAWRPPARLSLSEWADRFFYLSAESAAEPGRWRCLPYQRGIMDAITDPAIERVSLMKSARVGYTKIINAAIGYYMHQDPCPIMVVQPTLDDAQGYSKEEIAPMLRDCSALAELVPEPTAKDSGQTILLKAFPGGRLLLVGANSARGFRRVSARVLLFDEVDGYPPSAGAEGDQIRLGITRTQTFWNRKIIAGSTPLISGASRIEEMFESGDQRRYYVPCPHCGNMDFFVFRESFTLNGESAGHFMTWPDGRPEDAHFVCRACGCEIEHRQKREMIESGEWRAGAESFGHASFHVWAAYSYSPNATWGKIAAEFESANKSGPAQLKTFVNTVLGETWKESGDAPAWQSLYYRREEYAIGSVPERVKVLTVGVDVQKDRLIYEVVGWAEDKQSWSIEASVIPGDTSQESAPAWQGLHELLERTWSGAGGRNHTVSVLAVDSGFNTNVVYNWARRYPLNRVLACKGVPTAKVLLGYPSPVDVTASGKRIPRGYKVWPIGVNTAKTEFYGWLRLEPPSGSDPWPIGFCHFPEYDEEYFRQITAEQLVPITKRTGHTVLEWQVIPGRQNHWLDCRVLARAAASLLGLDRARSKGTTPKPATPPPAAPSTSVPPPASSRWNDERGNGGWLGGRGNNWFKRRR